jgi:hypothetical protein
MIIKNCDTNKNVIKMGFTVIFFEKKMIICFVNVETDPRLRYHTTHLPQQKYKTTISLWMFIFLLFWMKPIWEEGGDGKVIWTQDPT